MRQQLKLVKQFHKKFKQPILDNPTLIPRDRSDNRHSLMKNEVEEYCAGVENRDLENIAKELADILYATYGTILEHGLQNHIEAIFEELHYSNMSKEYHEYKMIKGPEFHKADIKKILTKKTNPESVWPSAETVSQTTATSPDSLF